MAGKIRDYDCTQDNFSKTEDEVKYKVSFLSLNGSMQQDWVIKLISIPIWCKHLVGRLKL